MKKAPLAGQNRFLRLLSFVVWYLVALVAVMALLPMLATLIESLYESLSGSNKVLVISLFFGLVGGWQMLNMRRN